MRYIIKYENFNESKGISDSCEKVLYDVWKLIEDDINNHRTNEIIIDIDEIDFKVSDLIIKYNIKISSERICHGVTNLTSAYIYDDVLTDSFISLDIEIAEIDDEFIYYIKSVLLHELLHLFQHYNILKGGKFKTESFSIGSVLPQLRKAVKSKYSNYLLDILYFSSTHELSAQLHQYYFYKTNNKEYHKLIQIKNLLSNFNIHTEDINHEEIYFIKKHIKNSMKYYTNNKKYIRNINSSLWSITDNDRFLSELKHTINKKVEWIEKKMRLIDSKLNEEITIKYDEIISLPSNWEDHEWYDVIEYQNFIIENLNDIPNNTW